MFGRTCEKARFHHGHEKSPPAKEMAFCAHLSVDFLPCKMLNGTKGFSTISRSERDGGSAPAHTRGPPGPVRFRRGDRPSDGYVPRRRVEAGPDPAASRVRD